MGAEFQGRIDSDFLWRQRDLVRDVLSEAGGIGPGFNALQVLAQSDSTWSAYLLTLMHAQDHGETPSEAADELRQSFIRGNLQPFSRLANYAASWGIGRVQAEALMPQIDQMVGAISAGQLDETVVTVPLLEECLKRDKGRTEIIKCLRGE